MIELLVVIAVIAVVLSLTLVGLASMRRAATQAACLRNIASCHQAFMLYTGDYKETWPIWGSLTSEPSFTNAGVPMQYGLHQNHWTMVVKSYLQDARVNATAMCPATPTAQDVKRDGPAALLANYPPSHVFIADYWYGVGFITGDDGWIDGGDPLAIPNRRARRVSDVAFSSQKGLLIERFRNHNGTGPQARAAGRDIVMTAFVDGSSSAPAVHDLRTGFDDRYPVLWTLQGLGGMDR